MLPGREAVVGLVLEAGVWMSRFVIGSAVCVASFGVVRRFGRVVLVGLALVGVWKCAVCVGIVSPIGVHGEMSLDVVLGVLWKC